MISRVVGAERAGAPSVARRKGEQQALSTSITSQALGGMHPRDRSWGRITSYQLRITSYELRRIRSGGVADGLGGVDERMTAIRRDAFGANCAGDGIVTSYRMLRRNATAASLSLNWPRTSFPLL